MPDNPTPVVVPQRVLDGLNIVRLIGTYNLFDQPAVVNMARQLDLVETADWIEAHPRDYSRGILFGFEPAGFWDAELSDMDSMWDTPGAREMPRLMTDEDDDDE